MKFEDLVSKVLLELKIDPQSNKALVENYAKSSIREAHEAIVSVSSKHYRKIAAFDVPRGTRLNGSIKNIFNQLVKSVVVYSESFRPEPLKRGEFKGYMLEENGDGITISSDIAYDYPTKIKVEYIRVPSFPPDTVLVDVPLGLEYVSAQTKALYYFDMQSETYEAFEAKAGALKSQLLSAVQVHNIDVNSATIDDQDGYDFYEDHI